MIQKEKKKEEIYFENELLLLMVRSLLCKGLGQPNLNISYVRLIKLDNTEIELTS